MARKCVGNLNTERLTIKTGITINIAEDKLE